MSATILAISQGGTGSPYVVLGNSVGIAAATATISLSTSYVLISRSSTVTLTLPDPTICQNKEINILNQNTGTVISATANVVPIAGGAESSAILPGTAGAFCKLVSDGGSWYIFSKG